MGAIADALLVTAGDGTSLFVHRWQPRSTPRGVVQIAHGLAEHAGRYGRLADALADAGFVVYANDHRGHGRTAPRARDLGHLGDRDGFRRCLDDLGLLFARIQADWPGLPVLLLGHSMGSFMAQHMLFRLGGRLAGVILSGSNGAPPPIAWVGLQLARLERLRQGPRGRSWLLEQMAFGDFNRAFRPARTRADWLSRDPAEVDRYLADPYCGFRPTNQTWIDLLEGIAAANDTASQRTIPKEMPILVLAGEEDPVSARTRGLEPLIDAYRAAGLSRVEHRFYPGARHEIFFETNRDQVTADFIAWAQATVG